MRRNSRPVVPVLSGVALSGAGVWMVVDELVSGEAYRRWSGPAVRDVDPAAYWANLSLHTVAALFILAATIIVIWRLIARRGGGREP